MECSGVCVCSVKISIVDAAAASRPRGCATPGLAATCPSPLVEEL